MVATAELAGPSAHGVATGERDLGQTCHYTGGGGQHGHLVTVSPPRMLTPKGDTGQGEP